MLIVDDDDIGEICCSPLHGSGGSPQTMPVRMTDALGLMWCQECQHRGTLINWGATHGFHAMEIHPYAMQQGAYFWYITAILGDEDRVGMILALIEMIDEAANVGCIEITYQQHALL